MWVHDTGEKFGADHELVRILKAARAPEVRAIAAKFEEYVNSCHGGAMFIADFNQMRLHVAQPKYEATPFVAFKRDQHQITQP